MVQKKLVTFHFTRVAYVEYYHINYTIILIIPSLLMLPSADEDNDDVIESFWLYIFSVFPSFVYYYLIILMHNFAAT